MHEAFAALGFGPEDEAAWEAAGRPDLDAWLTDRLARRPSGARARGIYGADDVHDFARAAILDALALGPADRLLEIGCGGGVLLQAAARTGAAATGLDHAPEMVALAQERHPDVVLGDAEALPFADGTFTAVAMAVVFPFLPRPQRALAECRRVLAPGGRLAVYTNGPELRGTPAAPEPVASQARFWTDAELAALARDAGFADAAVVNDGGGQLLTARRAPGPPGP